MPSEFINPEFDYTLVSKEEASKLRYFEGELLKSRKRVVAEVLEHGKILHDAQQLLSDHRNGTFRAWLESVGVGKDSAYRAIDAYLAFGSCRNCDNLEVSAMYELAKNEKAKNRALKLADKGIKITHAMAQKLIEDAKPKAIPAIKQPDPIPVKGKSYTESSGVPGDPGQFYESTGEDGRTESDGMEPQEEAPGPSRNDTEKPGDISTDSIVRDSLNRPIPAGKRPAHAAAAAIQTEARKLDAILRAIKELAQSPGGEFLELASIENEIKMLKGRIFGACYWSECPKCKGTVGKPCSACEGRGWWPQRKSGHVSETDKQWLGIE